MTQQYAVYLISLQASSGKGSPGKRGLRTGVKRTRTWIAERPAVRSSGTRNSSLRKRRLEVFALVHGGAEFLFRVGVDAGIRPGKVPDTRRLPVGLDDFDAGSARVGYMDFRALVGKGVVQLRLSITPTFLGSSIRVNSETPMVFRPRPEWVGKATIALAGAVEVVAVPSISKARPRGCPNVVDRLDPAVPHRPRQAASSTTPADLAPGFGALREGSGSVFWVVLSQICSRRWCG